MFFWRFYWKIMPQALRHEPSREQLNRTVITSSSSNSLPREKRTADKVAAKIERPEIVHARIANKLGRGDIAAGWLLFGSLSDNAREFLTSCERRDALDSRIVDLHRASAHSDIRRRAGGRPA